MRLRPDISTHPELGERAYGGRLGAFSRGFHRLWWEFFEVPEFEGHGAPTDLGEARDARPEVLAGGAAELDTLPARTNRQGQVVDAEQRRRIRDAETEVAASYETRPQPESPHLRDLSIE